MTARSGSLDAPTVEGFGFEWSAFDQSARDAGSLRRSFERYTRLFPFGELPAGAVGLDVGTGSGRWAAQMLARDLAVVGLDASEDALTVARRNASGCPFVQASAVELPFRGSGFDFAFSLGVLHHLPDTEGALREIRRVLRPGAPFLVYLYYAFDNRPAWFRALWRASDGVRRVVSRAPHRARLAVTFLVALIVYLPLARAARRVEQRGRDVSAMPLSAYRHQPFYVMRTDALDRLGTRLEKRFTRAQVEAMLDRAGFAGVTVSDDWPYWCAVARA